MNTTKPKLPVIKSTTSTATPVTPTTKTIIVSDGGNGEKPVAIKVKIATPTEGDAVKGKTGTYKNGIVTYNYSQDSKKWEFIIPKTKTRAQYTLLVACGHGGLNKAHKIARQVLGAARRCGAVDGTARAAINAIVGKPTYRGINFSHAFDAN